MNENILFSTPPEGTLSISISYLDLAYFYGNEKGFGSTSYLTVHLNMQLTTFRPFNTKKQTIH